MLQQTPMPSQSLLVTRLSKAPNRFTLGARPRLPQASFADTLIQPLASLPHETEDTVLTGGTRSLNRRLLALNLEGTLARRPANARHDPALFARSA